MPELLAPAGGMDALIAAVQNGADAVYIGGKAFNARAFADNFNWDEVARAADYCHLRNTSLYITLNTMMLQGELDKGAQEARRAYLAGADALIVADMGLGKAIREVCPKIPLHASTQMCVHTLDGARMAGDLGFSRVVLARELSLDEIREITENCGIETEVFVHGALCSSVSGLCLLSSFIGERSGNRGRCAQPCRLEYEINGSKAYHLSMADLCTAELMPQLMQCGVSSFKIEGRMKNSQYVGGVVRAYRRILDEILEGRDVTPEIIASLNDFYNRTFTSAYLQGGTDVTAPDKPGNRNIDKEREHENAEDVKEKVFHSIEARIQLAEGQKPEITMRCGEYSVQTIGDEELAHAKKPLQLETVAHAMSKTGGTPFEVKNTKVDIAGSPFISVSALNHLRKAGIAALEEEMIKSLPIRECAPGTARAEEKCLHSLIDVYVQTGDVGAAVHCLKAGAKRVYFAPAVFNSKTLGQAKTIEKKTGVKPYIVLPPFMRQKEMDAMDSILSETSALFGGALAGNFGQVKILQKYFDTIVADYTCNIANAKTARIYRDMGFTGVTLSAELNKKDINAIKSCAASEMIAYGYLPLMWLAHPLPEGKMRDRRGYTYEIQKIKVSGDLYAIKNPVLLAVHDTASIRHSVDAVRLLMNTFEADILKEYITAVREDRDAEIVRENTSQGHLKRGV